MTRTEFIEGAKAFFEEHCVKVLETKGRDYEGEKMFAGLVATAEAMGISPTQVWFVFFKKHVDAITTYAKDGKPLQSESLESRVGDAINFLLIFAGMQGLLPNENLSPEALKKLAGRTQ
jgi:hypothetical protein